MNASLKKSFDDVTRRKGRTLMVTLGIFIGVLGLTSVNYVQDTLFSAFTYSVGSAANSPDLTLQVNRLEPALVPRLSAVANVRAVQMQSAFATQWRVSAAPGHVPLDIVSYPDLRHAPITPFQLTSGRYPGAGEIVLEYGDQTLQPAAIGDTVTVDTGQTTTAVLRVVGFASTAGLPSPAASGAARGYMSEAALTQAFGAIATAPDSQGPRVLHAIAIKVKNVSQANTTAAALSQALRAHGVTVLGVSLSEPFSQGILTAVNGIFTLLGILSIVAVLLSGLLILNTIMTLIAEQTPIIGTMKALGGTRFAIMRGYLVSVFIYSACGALPGIALGLLLGYALAANLAQTISLGIGPFTVAPWIIMLSLAVGFGVPLLASLPPLWMGIRITVREALSAYGVSAERGGGLLSGAAQRLPWMTQTMWLGLRGVFRKRGRAALTLLTLTLAGTTFLAVQTAVADTNQHLAQVYANYSYDVLASIHDRNSPLIGAISALPNVARVERFRELYGAQTRWGTVRVFGFQPDTQLYHPQLVSGRWLASSDTNAVLLNEEAAAATGLSVGDTLTLSNPHASQTAVGNQATWKVIGILRQPMDTLAQIGTVVTTVENANQLAGDPADFTANVLVQARDHAPGAVGTLTTQIDQIVNGGNALTGHAVETKAQVVRQRQQVWLLIYALLYSVALIVGAVGALGLANSLAASVLERQREIGLLRAMGASDWRVAQVFWVEGLSLGGLAWLLGALLGLPLAYAFIQVMSTFVLHIDFSIAPSAFLVMLVAVLLISLLAGAIPAQRASRVRVADMLRYE